MNRFERPELLWLLAGVVAIAAFETRAALVRVRGARALWGMEGARPGRTAARSALRVASLVSLVLAIAGPRLGTVLVREPSAGLDVAVVIDVSRSMLADDRGSTRLSRAKALAREAAGELQGARFALVLAKGDAATILPLSDQRDWLDAAIESAASESLSARGTDLGTALVEALRALDAETATGRAVLLLTDGDDLAGKAESAARRLADSGVPLFIVGFGTEEGSRLAGEGRTGRINKRRSASLRTLAERTSGAYAAEEDGRAVRGVWSGLASMAKKGGAAVKRSRVSSGPFILASALLAFLSRVLPESPLRGRRRRAREKARSAAVTMALLAAAGISSCGRARGASLVARAVSLNAAGDDQGAAALLLEAIPRLGREDAAVARYDLAAAYLSAGEPALAADILERAIEDASERDKADLLYNLGCARYAEGSYFAAWKAFRSCLEDRPGDAAARANLEFAWERMEAERENSAIERSEARSRGLGGEAEEEFDLVRAAMTGTFSSAEREEEGDGPDY